MERDEKRTREREAFASLDTQYIELWSHIGYMWMWRYVCGAAGGPDKLFALQHFRIKLKVDNFLSLFLSTLLLLCLVVVLRVARQRCSAIVHNNAICCPWPRGVTLKIRSNRIMCCVVCGRYDCHQRPPSKAQFKWNPHCWPFRTIYELMEFLFVHGKRTTIVQQTPNHWKNIIKPIHTHREKARMECNSGALWKPILIKCINIKTPSTPPALTLRCCCYACYLFRLLFAATRWSGTKNFPFPGKLSTDFAPKREKCSGDCLSILSHRRFEWRSEAHWVDAAQQAFNAQRRRIKSARSSSIPLPRTVVTV